MTIIPHDRFRLDGKEALLSVSGPIENSWAPALGRLCDVCKGLGWVVEGQTMGWPAGEQVQCPKCLDTGEAVFEIDVETHGHTTEPTRVLGVDDEGRPRYYRTYLVYITEILKVYEQSEEGGCPGNEAHICVYHGRIGGEPVDDWCYYDGDVDEWEITPPEKTSPGDHIIRLAVH